MTWSVQQDHITVGDVYISFERTLRVPDDGSTYPLPPTFGSYPLAAAPGTQSAHADLIMPVYVGEALWIAFRVTGDPAAIQVEAGGVNVISGESEGSSLSGDPQNYIVAPNQAWLDGINSGTDTVRQFTARAIGNDTTLGEKLHAPSSALGTLTLRVFPAKSGAIAPHEGTPESEAVFLPDDAPLGLAAEGKVRQQIIPDPYGVAVWDPARATSIRIAILAAQSWSSLTRQEPPDRAATPDAYAEAGLPWFDYYDEASGDVPAPRALSNLPQTEENPRPLAVDPSAIQQIKDK